MNNYERNLNDDMLLDMTERVPALVKLMGIVRDDVEQRFQFEVRKNYFTIYYKGGKLSNFWKDGGEYKTDFDADYEKQYNGEKRLYGYCNNQGKPSANKAKIKEIGNKNITLFVDNINLYLEEMDAWFAVHPKAERTNQQTICNLLRKENSPLFLTDIEYSIERARFDMVGVDNRGDINLIELKVGNHSISSNIGSGKLTSGLYKHYLDYKNTVNNIEHAKTIIRTTENIVRIRKKLYLPVYEGRINTDPSSIKFQIWLADYSLRGKAHIKEMQAIKEKGGDESILLINPPFLSQIKKKY